MSKPIEIMARGLAKQRIICVRSFDTEPKELKRNITAAVQHAWPEFISEAQAALDALAAAGYAVVPIEPTEAMLQGGGRAYDYPSTFMGGASKQSLKTIPRIYSAMIAAAGE